MYPSGLIYEGFAMAGSRDVTPLKCTLLTSSWAVLKRQEVEGSCVTISCLPARRAFIRSPDIVLRHCLGIGRFLILNFKIGKPNILAIWN